MSDWGVLGLEGDPTPGDPDRTSDLAGKLLRQAELAEGNRRRLEGVAAGGGGLGLEGDYAPKFREVLAELPGELGKLGTAYRGAGEALRAFAADLRTEKSRAGAALRQGSDAQSRYEGALREIRALLPGDRQLQISPMLGVETSVEQATEGLDEATRAQARAAARRARSAEADKAAARRLADQAARLRVDAEGRAADGINRALDHSGIKNKSWWEKAWDVVSWPFQSWDNFVSFCRGVALVVGVVALFISGPVGWALVGVALAAGAVAFGDTLAKYVRGEATLGDLALDALGLIPGTAGAIRLAGMGTRLMGMAKNLPTMGKVVLGSLRNARTAVPHAFDVARSAAPGLGGVRAALQQPRLFARAAKCRLVGRDPIDMATGEMILQQDPDVTLPGLLPFVLQRTYRSAYRVGRWFGPSWSSTIEHRLEVDDTGVGYAAADGLLFAYPWPQVGETVLPEEGPRLALTRHADSFTVTDPTTGRTLLFATGTGTNGDHPTTILPLAAVTDRNANRIDFDYDADGNLVAIRYSGGYHLDVETEQGLITEIRLRTAPGEPDVVIMRYDYDRSGHLVGVVNSSGLPLRFSYDEHGRMTGWEDRNGIWYRYTYDDWDRCVATTGTDGYLSGTITYDKSERTTTETNSLGHATTYHYNDALQIERMVNALGGVTHYEWDRYDRKLAETDPLGRTTRWTYDDVGKLVATIRPDGSATTSTYNHLRLPVTTTTPDGAVWQRSYDDRGNLVALTDPLGATTRYAYGGQGQLNEVTDALGHTRRFESDAAGLPVAVTDPLGMTTRYERDHFGRVVQITDALGGITGFTWTIEGRIASQTGPDGATERWNYDAEGNLVEHIDALGQATRTEMVPIDLPGTQAGPDGARLSYDYDPELRLIAVTNPQGLVWRYDYDPAGNLTREVDFNGRVLTYAYDAAGQLVERTNGAGESTRLVRDILGNVVEQVSNGAVTRFSYDPLGRLTRTSKADCTLTFERDPLGRVLAETCNGRTVMSAYDPLGRRVERRTPSGAVSVWEYGDNNQPRVLYAGSHSVRFHYDALGREVERRLGDQVAIAQHWDVADRLVSQAVTISARDSGAGPRLIQRRSYTYRADGYMTCIDDLLTGQRHLDLDSVGRITGVHSAAWTERYAYDPAGNVTSGTWPLPSAPKAMDGPDARGDREYVGALLRRAGKVRYEHDAEGHVVLRQEKRLSAKPRTWRYVWDADDRLTRVITPDGEHWRYRYDPLGRRIAKEHVAHDGTIVEQVEFSWDGVLLAEQNQTRLTSEQERPRGRATTWDWEPGSFRAVTQTERVSLGDGPQDTTHEHFYVIVTDVAGTPAELVLPEGDVASRGRTTVWGLLLEGPAVEGCPLRFPGQYFDPEAQAHYNFFRYYDPSTAHYLTSDPAGLALGSNPYAYVKNPLSWIDPLGLGSYFTDASRSATPTSRTLDELSQQGQKLDRNGLTEAGRALQKHANRAGNTAYPKVPGSKLNKEGQNVLDDILTHPQTAERRYAHPNYGPVREFLLPDKGARFEEFGRLIGFL